MTRCVCCNAQLSDYEATMRHVVTGEFLDTCTDCLSVIAEDVPMLVHDNPGLLLNDNTLDDGGYDEWYRP